MCRQGTQMVHIAKSPLQSPESAKSNSELSQGRFQPFWTPNDPSPGCCGPSHAEGPQPRRHSLPGLLPVGVGDVHHCGLALRVHCGERAGVRPEQA